MTRSTGRFTRATVTLGVTFLSTTALTLGSATPAAAGSMVTWSMNERGGSTMVSSGAGPNGHIGAGVRLGASGAAGTAYTFASPAPQSRVQGDRLVTVSNASGGRYLNPGAARITVAVSVRTGGSGEYNVMQKGQARTHGGFYKMEINGNGSRPGRPACTFGTGRRGYSVSTTTRVNDGRWHRIACTKAASGGRVVVTLTVDGVAKRRVFHAATFAISNTLPLSIGGKSSCNASQVDCDYFEGSLDQASVRIG